MFNNFQLDLTKESDQELLDEWLASPQLLWVHLAPVCGTASQAREIKRNFSCPRPLRSLDFPHGLPSLSDKELQRVTLANTLFEYSCIVFERCIKRGVLVTMENPRSSYFWVTGYFLRLQRSYELFCTDFQVCMLGGTRDKWTTIVASFHQISQLDIKCDHSHTHAPWGLVDNPDGSQTWATAEESQYPRKMCFALVHVVLQVAAEFGIILKPESIAEVSNHPLLTAQAAAISSGKQPRGHKIPPIVPEFSSVKAFFCQKPDQVPCALQSKLTSPFQAYDENQHKIEIPKHARFLRGHFLHPEPTNQGGCAGVQDAHVGSVDGSFVLPVSGENKRKSCAIEDAPDVEEETNSSFKVVFGLPWDCDSFIQRACSAGHPLASSHSVPVDLQSVVEKLTQWTPAQVSSFRAERCKRWLKRAVELEHLEKQDWLSRPDHVRRATKQKRLLLTEEILQEIGYEDIGVIELLRKGSPLIGEVECCPVFKKQYRPCMSTVKQLKKEASKRNQAILGMTKSSGNLEVDKQLLAETEFEVERGWADGPFLLSELPEGSTVSHRFPLVQKDKTRLIDDFSVSGLNDTCVVYNKVELHMVDTFASVVRSFFQMCEIHHKNSKLVAKTYDLKSAYRQIPAHADHLQHAFVSVFNWKLGQPQIFRMLTLPFGATYSVFTFLRLARMLFAIATRGLLLLTTNFYDDFVLASSPDLLDSARHSMELIFTLTGWSYAKDGKKATEFHHLCKALGVEFDLSKSENGVLGVQNTAQRIEDLVGLIDHILEPCELGKQDCLSLRGKLGFADSFLHGRLGAFLLKQLVSHAYGRSRVVSDDLRVSLDSMKCRLQHGRQRRVDAKNLKVWYVFTDASFEQSTTTGGIGGVLIDEHDMDTA